MTRRGTRKVRAGQRWGGGDGSASGSASTHRFRRSHLIHPPIAPHVDNRVAIVHCDNG
jgi:hypothetical protein